MKAEDVSDDLESVLLSREEIDEIVQNLAAKIDRDYAGKEVLLVGVLKGALMIMADLSRAMKTHVTVDFMAVSSYGPGTKSSGMVRIIKDLEEDLMNRHVLIVEDIVDSGLTLSWLKTNLESHGPASVEIVTLLRTTEALAVDIDVKYIGRDIPNEFGVGYGLDFGQKYRNLDVRGTLAPHVYQGCVIVGWWPDVNSPRAPSASGSTHLCSPMNDVTQPSLLLGVGFQKEFRKLVLIEAHFHFGLMNNVVVESA